MIPAELSDRTGGRLPGGAPLAEECHSGRYPNCDAGRVASQIRTPIHHQEQPSQVGEHGHG